MIKRMLLPISHRWLTALAVFLVLRATPGLAAAAEAADADIMERVKQGQAHLEKGEKRQAFEILEKAFRDDPTNAEANFLYGRAAYELGDYETAATAFERALMQYPQSSRIKLELARTYLKMNARDMAKALFDEVLQESPPEAVKKNIEAYLSSMRRETRKHRLSGLLQLGVNYDSNVTFATDDRSIDTVIGTLTLADDALPDNDFFFSTLMVLDYRYNISDSPFSLKLVGINYNQFYDTSDDLDLVYYGVQAGPVLDLGQWHVELLGLFNFIEKDYDSYLKSWGLRGTGTYVIDQNWAVKGSLKLENQKFYTDRDRDGHNFRAELGPVYAWGPNRITLAAGIEDNNASLGTLSYYKPSFSVRYDRRFPYDLEAHASYRYARGGYRNAIPLFGEAREEHTHDFGIGVAKRWNKYLSTQLDYKYTYNNANISLYTYDRHAVTLNLSFNF